MIVVVILGRSTTSFSENVVVAKTSYQLLQVLSFCDRESAKPPHSRPQSPSFLGHVVGKRVRLQIKPSGSGTRMKPPLIKVTVLTFLLNKKYSEAFRGVYFLRISD